MLKIKDSIDLFWLMNKYRLHYACHCDMPGKYLFYDDTLYIEPRFREIIDEEPGNEEHKQFILNLWKENLVEKKIKERYREYL